MSYVSTLPSVYAQQYGANVYALAQQKGSLLRNCVRVEDMKGESRFFDRVAPVEAARYQNKYSTTQLTPSTWSRRKLTGLEYIWADMIDWADDLNLLIDPTSALVSQGGYAMGRVIDDIIIAGLSGSAWEGAQGTTEVVLPDSQKIAATVGGESNANTGLNLEKLIRTRSLFGKNDIDVNDPENELFMAVTQAQLDDLLRVTEVTSAEYNTVRALVNGNINTFMGFKFVRTGRLPKIEVEGAVAGHKCYAWCKSGVVLCVPQDINMSIDRRPDMNNNWQALAKLKAGAARIEDEKVVEVACYEA